MLKSPMSRRNVKDVIDSLIQFQQIIKSVSAAADKTKAPPSVVPYAYTQNCVPEL